MLNHSIYKYTISTLILSLTILTILSGIILSAPSASADTSASVNVSVTVPSVCSLTASPESVSNTIYPGHDDAIGETNIKAICNDPAGLAVYAVGYTDSTYGNTDLVSTVGGTTNVIHTNVTTSGTPSASEWYMTLTAVSGDYIPTIVTNFDSAHEIPDVYTKVAYRNSVTDMGTNATGANFTAAFDAYIAENQAAGTYTGKVKFLLVHPSTHDAPITPVAVAHQICYYGNGEDEGAMACQTTIDIDNSTTTISAGADVQLRAPNFSRAGYGFKSWNTKEDGTGTNYGPNETITFTQDMYDNGLALFANWVQSTGTLQSFSCSNLASGAVTALTDTRDNDTYAVAKLADGKCWMIENLRLDYDADITTSNTQSNNGQWGDVFAGLAEPESANITNSTTANSLYTTDTTSTSLRIITGGDSNNYSYRFPRYNNVNTASRVANQTSANENIYSYGNYYTWPAAIADTTYYPTSTKNQSITTTSICPTGWHLPTGGDKGNIANNEWWVLTRAIIGVDPANYSNSNQPYYTNINNTTEGTSASKTMRTYPVNHVWSGGYYGTYAGSRGVKSMSWSSTVNDSIEAYNEDIGNSWVSPGTYGVNKHFGFTVRCLAD